MEVYPPEEPNPGEVAGGPSVSQLEQMKIWDASFTQLERVIQEACETEVCPNTSEWSKQSTSAGLCEGDTLNTVHNVKRKYEEIEFEDLENLRPKLKRTNQLLDLDTKKIMCPESSTCDISDSTSDPVSQLVHEEENKYVPPTDNYLNNSLEDHKDSSLSFSIKEDKPYVNDVEDKTLLDVDKKVLVHETENKPSVEPTPTFVFEDKKDVLDFMDSKKCTDFVDSKESVAYADCKNSTSVVEDDKNISLMDCKSEPVKEEVCDEVKPTVVNTKVEPDFKEEEVVDEVLAKSEPVVNNEEDSAPTECKAETSCTDQTNSSNLDDTASDTKCKEKKKKKDEESLDACKNLKKDEKTKRKKFERCNIRDIRLEENLDAVTLAAQKEEKERIQRIQEAQMRALQERLKQIEDEKEVLTQLFSQPPETSHLFEPSPDETADLASDGVTKPELPLIRNENDVVLLESSDEEKKAKLQELIPPPQASVENVIDISSSDSDDEMGDDDDLDKKDDDIMVLSDEGDSSEGGGSGEAEDPNNSGAHTNDCFNMPDMEGRVLVNVGHPPEDPDIFLAPQIAKVIKPHQIGGIRFLYDNVVENLERYKSSSGFGCILAHSMGLGKTVQVVSFVDVFLRHTPATLVLCIVPINTIQNWKAEFDMWVPPVNSVDESQVESGEIRPRDYNVYTLNENFKTMAARAALIAEWRRHGGVLLMGYEMYRMLALRKMPKIPVKKTKRQKKLEAFMEPETNDQIKKYMDQMYEHIVIPGPDLVICDEGHRIKNSLASTSMALKSIKTRRRVVLTGYPLQNNLLEYWCMVDFVRPNYLGSRAEFCNMFERPISNGQCIDSTPRDRQLMRFRSHVLHSLLVGFVQRRGHSVLRAVLPKKEEHVLLIRMTPIQRKLYKCFVKDLLYVQRATNPLKLFAVCCKIWNHPDILYKLLQEKKMQEDIDLDIDLATLTPGSTIPGTNCGMKKKATPSKQIAKAIDRMQPIKLQPKPLKPLALPAPQTQTQGQPLHGMCIDSQPPFSDQSQSDSQSSNQMNEQLQYSQTASTVVCKQEYSATQSPHPNQQGQFSQQQQNSEFSQCVQQNFAQSSQASFQHAQYSPPSASPQQFCQQKFSQSSSQQHYSGTSQKNQSQFLQQQFSPQSNSQQTSQSQYSHQPVLQQQYTQQSQTQFTQQANPQQSQQQFSPSPSAPQQQFSQQSSAQSPQQSPAQSQQQFSHPSSVQHQPQFSQSSAIPQQQFQQQSPSQSQHFSQPSPQQFSMQSPAHTEPPFHPQSPSHSQHFTQQSPAQSHQQFQQPSSSQPFCQQSSQQQQKPFTQQTSTQQQQQSQQFSQPSSQQFPQQPATQQQFQQTTQQQSSYPQQPNNQQSQKYSQQSNLQQPQQYVQQSNVQQQYPQQSTTPQQQFSQQSSSQSQQYSQQTSTQQQQSYPQQGTSQTQQQYSQQPSTQQQYPQQSNTQQQQYSQQSSNQEQQQYHQSSSNQQQQYPQQSNTAQYSQQPNSQQQHYPQQSSNQQQQQFSQQSNAQQYSLQTNAQQYSQASNTQQQQFPRQSPPQSQFSQQNFPQASPQQHFPQPSPPLQSQQFSQPSPQPQSSPQQFPRQASPQQMFPQPSPPVQQYSQQSPPQQQFSQQSPPQPLSSPHQQYSKSSPPHQGYPQQFSQQSSSPYPQTSPPHQQFQQPSHKYPQDTSPQQQYSQSQLPQYPQQPSPQQQFNQQPQQQPFSQQSSSQQSYSHQSSQQYMHSGQQYPQQHSPPHFSQQTMPNQFSQSPQQQYTHQTVPQQQQYTQQTASQSSFSHQPSQTSNQSQSHFSQPSPQASSQQFSKPSTQTQQFSQPPPVSTSQPQFSQHQSVQSSPKQFNQQPSPSTASSSQQQFSQPQVSSQQSFNQQQQVASSQQSFNSQQQSVSPQHQYNQSQVVSTQQQFSQQHQVTSSQQTFNQQGQVLPSQQQYSAQTQQPASTVAPAYTPKASQTVTAQSFVPQQQYSQQTTHSAQSQTYTQQQCHQASPSQPYQQQTFPQQSTQPLYQQQMSQTQQTSSVQITPIPQSPDAKQPQSVGRGRGKQARAKQICQPMQQSYMQQTSDMKHSTQYALQNFHQQNASAQTVVQQNLQQTNKQIQKRGGQHHFQPIVKTEGVTLLPVKQEPNTLPAKCQKAILHTTTKPQTLCQQTMMPSRQQMVHPMPIKNHLEGSQMESDQHCATAVHDVAVTPYQNRMDSSINYEWAIPIMKDYVLGVLENSHKMMVLFVIIEQTILVGDKILVFSQSLSTLDLLEHFLSKTTVPRRPDLPEDTPVENWCRNKNYFRLDGSTSAQEREKLINEFNKNENVSLFLLSTRAGCLGINLVGANRIVVMDASWNPCHDAQAVCRIYRYGQKKPCHIYRLVTDNSLEKKIYDRQVNKQGMSDRVVDELNPESNFTWKDVTTLIQDNEDDGPVQELSTFASGYADEVLKYLVTNMSHNLSKEPFEHESLLLDRKDLKLTKQEKRLAKQSYEMAKRANMINIRTTYTYLPAGTAGAGGQFVINNKQCQWVGGTTIRVLPSQSTPIPMQPSGVTATIRTGTTATPITASPSLMNTLFKQGVMVQKLTMPSNVSIPVLTPGAPPVVIPAGQDVLVLRTPKGVYLRLPDGRIIAVQLPPSLLAKTQFRPNVVTHFRPPQKAGNKQATATSINTPRGQSIGIIKQTLQCGGTVRFVGPRNTAGNSAQNANRSSAPEVIDLSDDDEPSTKKSSSSAVHGTHPAGCVDSDPGSFEQHQDTSQDSTSKPSPIPLQQKQITIRRISPTQPNAVQLTSIPDKKCELPKVLQQSQQITIMPINTGVSQQQQNKGNISKNVLQSTNPIQIQQMVLPAPKRKVTPKNTSKMQLPSPLLSAKHLQQNQITISPTPSFQPLLQNPKSRQATPFSQANLPQLTIKPIESVPNTNSSVQSQQILSTVKASMPPMQSPTTLGDNSQLLHNSQSVTVQATNSQSQQQKSQQVQNLQRSALKPSQVQVDAGQQPNFSNSSSQLHTAQSQPQQQLTQTSQAQVNTQPMHQPTSQASTIPRQKSHVSQQQSLMPSAMQAKVQSQAQLPSSNSSSDPKQPHALQSFMQQQQQQLAHGQTPLPSPSLGTSVPAVQTQTKKRKQPANRSSSKKSQQPPSAINVQNNLRQTQTSDIPRQFTHSQLPDHSLVDAHFPSFSHHITNSDFQTFPSFSTPKPVTQLQHPQPLHPLQHNQEHSVPHLQHMAHMYPLQHIPPPSQQQPVSDLQSQAPRAWPVPQPPVSSFHPFGQSSLYYNSGHSHDNSQFSLQPSFPPSQTSTTTSVSQSESSSNTSSLDPSSSICSSEL